MTKKVFLEYFFFSETVIGWLRKFPHWSSKRKTVGDRILNFGTLVHHLLITLDTAPHPECIAPSVSGDQKSRHGIRPWPAPPVPPLWLD